LEIKLLIKLGIIHVKNFNFRLGNLLNKPDINKITENNEKALALKIMSLDLNTNQE